MASFNSLPLQQMAIQQMYRNGAYRLVTEPILFVMDDFGNLFEIGDEHDLLDKHLDFLLNASMMYEFYEGHYRLAYWNKQNPAN